MNLRTMLDETVRRYPDKMAIALGERRLSYAELDELSNRVASGLMKIGLAKGDRVAMLLSNSPDFAVIYFGIVKAGAIAVPLDTKYKLTEISALISDCQPKVLIGESAPLEAIGPALAGFKSIERVISLGPDYRDEFLSYQALLDSGSAQPVEVDIKPEDAAHIAYTSGPTLHPRGVVLSHRSLVTEAAISAAGFGQGDSDRVVLFALPMHHAFGLVVILFTSVYKGSTVVMLNGVSVSSLMELIEREKATMFMGVPFVHALMVSEAEEKGMKYDLSSLRLCGSAGAALPEDIAQRFRKIFGLGLVDFWGQTEASAHVTCCSLNGASVEGSVGKALPGWQLKILDEKGRELPANHRGEIVVRGPLMSEYYGHPRLTATVLRGGWLYTGDLGMVDDRGNLFLFGNKKGMIIAKGQNIFPGDIEEVLLRHPKVAEAAVVGMPDEVRGETIRAVIRLKAGEKASEQEMKRFCQEHLANYKVPKQVIFVDSIPRTESGEIRKEALRKL